MRAATTLARLVGLTAMGAAAQAGETPTTAPLDAEPQAVWVGSVWFNDETSEYHIENGDLAPAAGGTLSPGTYSNTMRRLDSESATIEVAECAAGGGCEASIAGTFQSSERSDAKQERRWVRECPKDAAEARSIRSELALTQSFQQKRGPTAAALSIDWDASRAAWVIEARLLPGSKPLPVCDDLTSVVESQDPGCGEPTPAPTSKPPPPPSGACLSPALGEAFTVSAPADAARLKGSKVLESSKTPDPAASGWARQKDGSAAIERRVVYDLVRIDRSASN